MPTTGNKRRQLSQLTKAEREEAARASFNECVDWAVRQITDGVITKGFGSIRGNLLMALHGYASHMKTHRDI